MSELVRGRKIGPRDLALLPIAGGRWLRRTYLEPTPILRAGAFEDVLAGVYLVTTDDDRIVWLGQALRHGGVAARLRTHLTFPARAEAFRLVRVLQLHDFTPEPALRAIEGRAADLLKIRGTLGQRRWPASSGWDDLAGRSREEGPRWSAEPTPAQ